MPSIVTGISPDGDTTALERGLKAAGLSLEPLEVLGNEAAASVATAVPGVARAAGLEDRGTASLWERLDDFGIPDDEVEHYAEALEAGRSIVAYRGDAEDEPTVTSLFSSSGLTKIKTFHPR